MPINALNTFKTSNECIGYIYRIRNKETEMVYIGQTCDYVRRWKQHFKPQSRCPKLREAIKIYGVHAFEKMVIEVVSAPSMELLKYYLHAREYYWIEDYNSVETGYSC